MRSLKRDVKGQAAMEFLMTYGWAILAAVIAIAALAYFGVFSPSRYIPELCTINAPLGCEDSKITASEVSVVLRNGGGETIDVNNITISGCASDLTGWNLGPGATEDIDVTCDNSLTGDTFSGNIEIGYLRAGDTFHKTTTGSVSGQVG